VVTALLPLAQRLQADWVACARTAVERKLAAARPDGTGTSYDGGHIRYATPSEDEVRMHYSVISNPILWYTQHYLWDLGHEPRFNADIRTAWRKGYVEVNRKLAQVAAEVVRSREVPPVVLSHDYQLYLFPRMLRELAPDAIIQHFTHIPWPTPQYWKVLPQEIRDEIVVGLLGADVLGFQSKLDVRNFLLTAQENLGLRVHHGSETVMSDGRAVRVRAYPISIDVEATERLARSRAVELEEERLNSWRPEHLIVRVDRTDPTKNIVRGFLAYEKLLVDHAELRGRVQFWSFLQPSRQELPRYRSLLYSIKSTAGRINSELGRNGWLPIRLEFGENIRRAAAAYKNFDVLLVNSVFDGMNLVAKEGMLLNRRDGVLVLSENTGAHEELGEFAIGINPFEIDATADALYSALTMPARERHARALGCREVIRRNDLTGWIDRQLKDLDAVSRAQPNRLAG
jgi:trehalose 6-phosphate synthase